MDKLKVNQAQFAKLLGVNRAKISKYLDKNDNYYPGYGTLKLINTTFPNLNMTWLLTGNEEMWKIDFDESQIRLPDKQESGYKKQNTEEIVSEQVNHYSATRILSNQEIMSELVMQNKKLVDIVERHSITIENLSRGELPSKKSRVGA